MCMVSLYMLAILCCHTIDWDIFLRYWCLSQIYYIINILLLGTDGILSCIIVGINHHPPPPPPHRNGTPPAPIFRNVSETSTVYFGRGEAAGPGCCGRGGNFRHVMGRDGGSGRTQLPGCRRHASWGF